MNLLLDTHVLIWWAEGHPKLSSRAVNTIQNADHVFFSAASVWEIATKVRLGKFTLTRALSDVVNDFTNRLHFEPLSITPDHARLAGEMTGNHKDPFDRMLIAQAQHGNLTIISADKVFNQYNIRIIW